MSPTHDVREIVKEKYGQAAVRVTTGGSSCCGAAAACGTDVDGGRFAVSDVVVRGDVPEEVRKHLLLWAGCIAGALKDSDYTAILAKAGFEAIDIEPTRVYSIEDAKTFLSGQGLDVDALAPQVDGKFMSAFVRATKPAKAEGCCS